MCYLKMIIKLTDIENPVLPFISKLRYESRGFFALQVSFGLNIIYNHSNGCINTDYHLIFFC